MTEAEIWSITFTKAFIFVVAFCVGGILYDNHLDADKQKHAFDIGCTVIEYSNKVEYNCDGKKDSKTPKE